MIPDNAITTAILAAAPNAHIDIWLPVLKPTWQASGIVTPWRIAAFLGQARAEAGEDLMNLRENTYYSSADRISAIFPSHFPTPESAAPYVSNPAALADTVYANIGGNGDAKSGDGYMFRGGGLFGLTFRGTPPSAGRSGTGYSGFAYAMGMSIFDAAAYVGTPAGAVASACWYWTTHAMQSLADAWMLTELTRRVTGNSLEALDVRIAASNAARNAIAKAMA